MGEEALGEVFPGEVDGDEGHVDGKLAEDLFELAQFGRLAGGVVTRIVDSAAFLPYDEDVHTL